MVCEINRCAIQLAENVASNGGPFELREYVITAVIEKYYRTKIYQNKY